MVAKAIVVSKTIDGVSKTPEAGSIPATPAKKRKILKDLNKSF
jgi:hypothetical protein